LIKAFKLLVIYDWHQLSVNADFSKQAKASNLRKEKCIYVFVYFLSSLGQVDRVEKEKFAVLTMSGRDDDLRVRAATRPEGGQQDQHAEWARQQQEAQRRSQGGHYAGGSGQQDDFSGGSPAPLTPEERRVLNECNQESFFKRSMPATLLAGLATSIAGKQGYLKPNSRYGMGPKIALASILGYFVGKVSYVNVCADKFLTQAPDSKVADAIRQRRGMPPREKSELQPTDEDAAGLNYRREDEEEEAKRARTGGVTYDELRRRHRESHNPLKGLPQQQQQHRPDQDRGGFPLPPPPAETDQQDPSHAPPSKLRKKPPTNKYGDEGFE